jgi:hypothetical protein
MYTGKPTRDGSNAPVTNGKIWEVRVHRDSKAVSRQAKNPLNSKRSNAHNSRAVRKAAHKSPAEQVTWIGAPAPGSVVLSGRTVTTGPDQVVRAGEVVDEDDAIFDQPPA